MRTLSLLLVALGSITLATVWAADELPIFVYSCPYLQTAPTIDGRLDDPCWLAAPAVGGFTYFGKSKTMPVQTFFRIGYDTTGLYFAITCDEPNIEKISRVAVHRDSDEIFGQEAVEIFLDPSDTQRSFYQLGINAAGSLYDTSPEQGQMWDGNITVATALAADAWYAEVAVPWGEIGVQLQPGRVHGFNVCRDRYIGAGREWANWARVVGTFQDPARFAHLVLSPTAEQLGALEDEFRKGERTGPIRIYTAEGVGGESYRLLLKATLEKLEARLAGLHQMVGQESKRTRQELQRRLKRIEAEADQARQVIAKETVDAMTFTRLDVRLSELATSDLIWEARLQALLSDI